MNDKITNIKEKHNLSITESAINRINFIKSNEGKGFLRITVDGGGCSGFSYSFSFDKKTNDNDIIAYASKDGSPTLVTDNASIIYLNGSEITWEESLSGASFIIDNPNATSNCGCGTSFSVT